jgi:hypothetical protein
VISSNEFKMDPEKVKVIKEWTSLRIIFEVRIFHGLASFYNKFIINFSGFYAPMMDTVKKRHKSFKWIEEAERIFQYIGREDNITTNSGLTKFWKDIPSEM